MRTHPGTIGTVARRAGTAAAGLAALVGVAGLVQRQGLLRWSGTRRPGPRATPVDPAPAVLAPPPVTEVAAPEPPPPSPVQVARAVARNDSGLIRRNPSTSGAPRPRSVPGAKLPARAGQGIIGV